MQFKVPCPYDPKRFFFVSVITQGNENFEIDLGHHLPTIEYLFRKHDLDCSYGSACVNNTLLIIHSRNALKFDYFKLMIRDIILNDLNVTFGGLTYNDTLHIPGAVISATANDLRYAHKDVLEYLEGTTVCLEGRVHNHRALQDLAHRFGFTVCFSHKNRKAKDEELWGAWQNCKDSSDWISMPIFDKDETEAIPVRKSSAKAKKVSCAFDECESFEDNGWVKESIPSLPKHPYGGPNNPNHPNVRRRREEEEELCRLFEEEENEEKGEGEKTFSFDPDCDICPAQRERKNHVHDFVLKDEWFFDDLRYEDYGFDDDDHEHNRHRHHERDEHDHDHRKADSRKQERRHQHDRWESKKDRQETPRKSRREESRWF